MVYIDKVICNFFYFFLFGEDILHLPTIQYFIYTIADKNWEEKFIFGALKNLRNGSIMIQNQSNLLQGPLHYNHW